MPERIQLRRTKGWRKPEGAVVVSRPSRYGNPYRVGDNYLVSPLLPFPMPTARTEEGPAGEPDAQLKVVRCGDRATAVAWFRRWLGYGAENIRETLGGRDLACWCPLSEPCHADVLLEIANAPAAVTSHPRRVLSGRYNHAGGA